MRSSRGAFAIFRSETPEGPRWLVNWNAGWQAWHLVGGHLAPGEAARACAIREVAEELGLTVGEHYTLAAEPAARLQYEAVSRRTSTATRYRMALFAATLTAAGEARLAGRRDLAWVTAAEIAAGRAADGRPVSETTARLVAPLGPVTD